MFIGHFAAGLAGKKAAREVSLGTLFMASQFIDLLWPVFLLLGIEHVRIDPGNTPVTPLDFYDYPLTHSLAGTLFWALVVGGGYYLLKRKLRSALVVGALVASHWVLDLLTHRPDLPLIPGIEYRAGLGLWNSLPATLIVECAMFAGGIFFYARSTIARDRIGSAGFWILAGLLVLIYAANIFGPPPPEAGIIAVAGNATWLFVALAAWVDRHRTVLPDRPGDS